MAKFQWVRVLKHSPCPICKAPDWCAVSADGTVAKCMRVEDGCFRSKEDRNGARYYLHRLADGPRPDAPLPRQSGPAAKRADTDTLHEVYSALLSHLTLSQAHREALRSRRLVEEAIDRGGYRTLPAQGRPRIVRELRDRFGDKVLRVPGFIVKEGRSGHYFTLRGPAGLIVPCRDRAGRIVALKVRRDEEVGPRYVYVSSVGHGGPGPGSPIHVPLGTPDTAELVRLTEGELKADIIQALAGLPTLSVPGVSNWRPALEVLKALGCKTVRLAFDADCWDKPAVARALAACADALVQAGLAVELERWNAADGKGLDDLLAAGKAPELLRGDAALQTVREILAAASANEEAAAPDELARLPNVLESGGAEALFLDKPLLQGLADLAAANPAAFAAVRASIRERVSVRDLDRALRPFRRPVSPPEGEDSPAYFEQNGCTYRNAPTKEGPVPVALCNFTARIVEDVVHDDGAEQRRLLAFEGQRSDGTPLSRTEVPAADFARMDWPVAAWGTQAVVYAGQGTRDHLRCALQLLSPDAPRRTVYGHSGWREVGGAWHYLHAGGAIGPGGTAADVSVCLPQPLAGYLLPDSPEGAELAGAVRASLHLATLGPDRLLLPVLAAAYRSVLGATDFSLHLSGPSGACKTEVAALAQQHFGAGLTARSLPASWSSTGNALEGLAFAAKDALLAVDDFCPTGSAADVQRYHREADRLFRAQGNAAGRARLRADASLRPPRPPRGTVLSTGEDVPRGQSLRARLLVLEFSPGDIVRSRLTPYQADAAAGKYAAALAGFLRWLAPQYEAVHSRLKAEAAGLRDRATAEGLHARTPGIVADLALGLKYFLAFALEAGAVSGAEVEDLKRRGWKALQDAAAADQAEQVQDADPAGQFLRLLSAALASGRAHVAGPNGMEPSAPEAWGWRGKEYTSRTEEGPESDISYTPQGRRIGWLDGEQLYLEPEAAFAEAQELARQKGESLPVTARTLWKRLRDKGLLVGWDERRQRNTVRRTLEGVKDREVLHLQASVLSSVRLSEPSASPPDGRETAGSADGSCGRSNGAPRGPSAETVRRNGHEAAETPTSGRFGRLVARGDGPGEEANLVNGEWGEV